MNLKTLAATALVLIFGFSAPIYASVIQSNVTINGEEWEVSILETTFNDQSALLQSQPWWGDFGLASEFVLAFGIPDGTANIPSGLIGPYFAYQVGIGPRPDAILSSAQLFTSPVDTFAGGIIRDAGDRFRYAVAVQVAPVPLPAGLPLLLTGLVAFLGLRKRKMRAAQV